MAKRGDTNLGFMAYRLDSIERRLEMLESNITNSRTDPEIIHALLDIVKSSRKEMNHQPQAAADNVDNAEKGVDSAFVATAPVASSTSKSKPKQGKKDDQDLANMFDMARRRTIV